MEKLIKKLYHYKLISKIFHTLVYCLKRELKDCRSVLDLGCGPESPIKYCKVAYSVGVDVFEPYIKESKKRKIHHKYILKDITKVKFKPKSFDAVILIDALEHLKKHKGEQLLNKVEHWARKKIILSTPNGFLPQGNIDRNPFQIHRSGWEVEELKKRGYKVYGMAGLKFLRGGCSQETPNFAEIRFRPWFFWIIISSLTQLLTYYFPKFAFGVFYVKRL